MALNLIWLLVQVRQMFRGPVRDSVLKLLELLVLLLSLLCLLFLLFCILVFNLLLNFDYVFKFVVLLLNYFLHQILPLMQLPLKLLQVRPPSVSDRVQLFFFCFGGGSNGGISLLDRHNDAPPGRLV